jgi:hypothetical protein
MHAHTAREIAVYEDFPLTHVEWHLRQGRWDLGTITLYIYTAIMLYSYKYWCMHKYGTHVFLLIPTHVNADQLSSTHTV